MWLSCVMTMLWLLILKTHVHVYWFKQKITKRKCELNIFYE